MQGAVHAASLYLLNVANRTDTLLSF